MGGGLVEHGRHVDERHAVDGGRSTSGVRKPLKGKDEKKQRKSGRSIAFSSPHMSVNAKIWVEPKRQRKPLSFARLTFRHPKGVELARNMLFVANVAFGDLRNRCQRTSLCVSVFAPLFMALKVQREVTEQVITVIVIDKSNR